MKNLILVLLILNIKVIYAQSVLISPTNGSKLIETNSTNKAIQMPSVSRTEIIPSPQKGMVVFDNSPSTLSYFNGSEWARLYSAWEVDGTNLRNLNAGRVGIGTSLPKSKLHTLTGISTGVIPRLGTIETLETSGSAAYLSIISGGVGGVAFGSPDGNDEGGINYFHTSQKLNLRVAGGDRMTIDGVGNIGLGDTEPEVRLDVNGAVHVQNDLLLKEKLIQPNTSASYDPFDRQDKSFITIEPLTNVTSTIKGFSAPTTRATIGTVLYLSGGLSGSIVLKHNASTVLGDRIITNTGADVTITDRGGAIFIYSSLGWRLIAYAE